MPMMTAPIRLTLMIATVAPALAAAQQPSNATPQGDQVPPNTVVARFAVDSDALATVTSSVELVRALRQHLKIDVATLPGLKLQVAISGTVRNPVDGGDFPFLNGNLGFVYDSSQPASADFASLVRAFHPSPFSGDWDEDSTWHWLVRVVEKGLTTSLAANGTFFTDDSGHVPLRVTTVHLAPADQPPAESDEIVPSFYLKLQPHVELPYDVSEEDSASARTYDTQMVLIGLAPGPRPALPTVELPVAALEVLVGDYEFQPGKLVQVRREGSVLVARPTESGETPLRLTAASETEFWADSEGRRVEFVFTLGEDGRATAVTVKQAGFEMTAPRIP